MEVHPSVGRRSESKTNEINSIEQHLTPHFQPSTSIAF